MMYIINQRQRVEMFNRQAALDLVSGEVCFSIQIPCKIYSQVSQQVDREVGTVQNKVMVPPAAMINNCI